MTSRLSPQMMISIVIGVASVVVLLGTNALLASEVNPIDQACRISVLENANFRIGSKQFTELIDCPTQKITIEETKQDQVNKEMANYMVDCWKNFGEGELLLFEEQDENFCVVCHILSFEEENRQYTGFESYLTSNTAPGKKVTYYEYFTGNPPSDDAKQVASNEFDIRYFDSDKKYATVFTYNKVTEFWDKQTKEMVAYGAGGVVVGTVLVAAVGYTTIGVLTGGVGFIAVPLFIGAAGGAGVTTGFLKNINHKPTQDTVPGVFLIEFEPQSLAKLQCTQLPARQK